MFVGLFYEKKGKREKREKEKKKKRKTEINLERSTRLKSVRTCYPRTI